LLFLVSVSGCAGQADDATNSDQAATTASGEQVTSPTPGEVIDAPVWVRAHVVACNGSKSTSFGYSIDDETAFHPGVTVNDIDATVAVTAGAHIVHVKAWSAAGECPTVSIAFTSRAGEDGGAPPSDGGITVPAGATVAAALETSTQWKWNDDPGTKGSASGTSEYETAPDGTAARRFDSSYTGGGGEIFHLSFGNDELATHFVYDNWVYVVDPGSLLNLEMDMNQVVANGDTIIYGFQCAHGSGTWEYTLNDGTPAKQIDHWHPSNVACDPTTWKANVWHHIQVAYDRDDAGNVTYEQVAFDGKVSELIGAHGPSAFAIGWAKGDLLTNFQLDGDGASGSITAYAKGFSVSRW
jgi:hypothetical protein